MTQNIPVQSDRLETRELSVDEIEATSGAGIRDVDASAINDLRDMVTQISTRIPSISAARAR